MKYFIYLLVVVFSCSCSAPPQKPQRLLSKTQMAELIADLSIYNQGYLVNSKFNINNTNLFVLQKHKVTIKDFKENYQFYTFTPSSLDEIHAEAKKIILEKDPKMKEFLEKSKKEESIKPH